MILKIKKNEILVYISLMLYTVSFFMARINIYFGSIQFLLKGMTVLSIILSICNVILDNKMTMKQFFLFICITLLFLIDSLPSGWHEFIYIYIIIWSCRNCDYKRLIKYLLFIIGILMTIVALLTIFGIIENVVQVQNDRIRRSLGYTSWTILPFQLFSFSLLYIYLRKKLKAFEYLLIYGLNAIVFILTNVRTTLPLLFVGNLLMELFQRKKNFKWNKIRWMVIMPEIAMLFSYGIIYIYNTYSSIGHMLDAVFNYRLFNTVRAIHHYGIHLFSNFDARWIADESGYLIVDNSYYYILLTWGILGLILVLGIYSYILWYAQSVDDRKLFVITLMYVIVGVIWNRLFVLIETEMLICFSNIFRSKSISKQDNKIVTYNSKI